MDALKIGVNMDILLYLHRHTKDTTMTEPFNQFELEIGFSKSDFDVSSFEKFGEKIVLTNGSWILRVRTCAKSVCDW